jgi:hypothetical protein
VGDFDTGATVAVATVAIAGCFEVADLSRLGAGELDVRRDDERRSDGQGWNQ